MDFFFFARAGFKFTEFSEDSNERDNSKFYYKNKFKEFKSMAG